MADNKEMDVPVITLEDDLGNEQEFEILDVIDYEGEEYVVLLPMEDDADEAVILLLEVDDKGEESYIGIEDDDLIDAVFEVFKKKHTEFEY